MAPTAKPLQFRAMAAMYVMFAATNAVVYLTTNIAIAFALMFVSFAGASAVNGPLFAVIQSLVPERMRATSIAFIYLVANLIGLGLGPLAVGVISDLDARLGRRRIPFVTRCLPFARA